MPLRVTHFKCIIHWVLVFYTITFLTVVKKKIVYLSTIKVEPVSVNSMAVFSRHLYLALKLRYHPKQKLSP